MCNKVRDLAIGIFELRRHWLFHTVVLQSNSPLGPPTLSDVAISKQHGLSNRFRLMKDIFLPCFHYYETDNRTRRRQLVTRAAFISASYSQLFCPWPSCSKLTMSLVNDSPKFTSSDTQIC